MNLHIDQIPSPIGTILLVWENEAVRALYFADHEEKMRAQLLAHYGAGELKPMPAPGAFRRPVERYFEGDLTSIDRIPVQTAGTEFQRRTWKALRAIPAGSTLSYSELAKRIGSPGASRAVGAANGANPISLIVPCHRVIGANGTLTGYGGGMERKRWLLAHEQSRTGLLAAATLPLPSLST